ncbi:guanylate kinase [Microbacterium esteraromaticum]|nr:guanylate kinase [Microbacterium esteraromaticum]WDH77437.1 guanylate kinase [Microbacterium esteraromaticum]
MAENRTVPDVDRAAASRRALERRRARASLKRDLAMRVTAPQAVLRQAFEDADSDAATMRVTDFLMALPAIGAGKRDRVLEDLGISPVKRLGGLGVRQRAALTAWLDERFPPHRPREGRSRLLVLAGPTAVGKGTVAAHIRETNPDLHLSVSATTRSPRPGEVDGVHYYFLDEAEFDRLIEEGQLLEYATVHNKHRYGTPRGPVDEALAQGKTVLLEIDLQGARQVRESEPSASLVFLLPPTWDELVNRLVGRGTEDSEERARRLRTARTELAAQNEFDYLVVNADVATAARDVVELSSGSAR